MSQLYKQTANECAPAAVLYAANIPAGYLHPLSLGDEAAKIDQLPSNNMQEGGTQIDVCLYLLKKRGMIDDYLNIGARWELLRAYLEAGGKAVVSIPSQATTGGRTMRHAITILEMDASGLTYYDPATGGYGWQFWEAMHEAILQGTLMPQVYIIDQGERRFVADLARKQSRTRYTILVAVATLLGAVALYAILNS
jgi:hypothetical protein